MSKPNIIFVFADQWRTQSLGYMGNCDVRTPNIDKLSEESINLSNAVSGYPVCTPYRATLMTGEYPHKHGAFINDVCLHSDNDTFGTLFKNAGYNTAYIGKWHIDGHGRSEPIPEDRRHGFDYWKVLECTHTYNNSPYYHNDDLDKKYWKGYDAIAQTEDAIEYLKVHDPKKPFLMVLSWGPPHAPYETAPKEFQDMYNREIVLPLNVPKEYAPVARVDLAGYYAHCSALDFCMGKLQYAIKELNLDKNTIFIFTSDHGDMLYSHGQVKKQQPFDESIRVPFLLKYPKLFNNNGTELLSVLNSVDILPTLLDLAEIEIPNNMEGKSYKDYFNGGNDPKPEGALLQCLSPFGQWSRQFGGQEYRGLRTERYTYIETLDGTWMLYDNKKDPFQLNNLLDDNNYQKIQLELATQLSKKLVECDDNFTDGEYFIKKWNYKVKKNGSMAYED